MSVRSINLELRGRVVTVDRPPLKPVWLDTSVVLSIALHHSDQRPDDRYDRLFNAAMEDVEEGPFLFVDGEQEEEVIAERQTVLELYRSFTLSAALSHKLGIQDVEMASLLEPV